MLSDFIESLNLIVAYQVSSFLRVYAQCFNFYSQILNIIDFISDLHMRMKFDRKSQNLLNIVLC